MFPLIHTRTAGDEANGCFLLSDAKNGSKHAALSGRSVVM